MCSTSSIIEDNSIVNNAFSEFPILDKAYDGGCYSFRSVDLVNLLVCSFSYD